MTYQTIFFSVWILFLKPPRHCIPASASEDFHTFDVAMKIWGFKPLTYLLSLLNMSASFYDLIVKPILILTWILNNVHKYVSVSFCTDIPLHVFIYMPVHGISSVPLHSLCIQPTHRVFFHTSKKPLISIFNCLNNFKSCSTKYFKTHVKFMKLLQLGK